MKSKVSSKRILRFAHVGKASELYRIIIINTILKIVTLGLYHFWAKTRVRKYLWSHTSIDREFMEYTGTGKELLIGGILAALIIVSASLGGNYIELQHPDLAPFFMGAVFILFTVLIGIAKYASLRYSLSRTRWRAIQFGMTGSAIKYAGKWIGNYALCFLTLGIYYPFIKSNLVSYKVNNIWFGSEPLSYTGCGKDMLKPFLQAYFLAIPTLGISWFMYIAYEKYYFAQNTHFQGAVFEAEFYALELMQFWLVNFLLIFFTFGLAFPIVLLRIIQFNCERYRLVGEVEMATVTQQKKDASSFGEGVLDNFDLAGI
ncbi:MAG: YjgN family protein [Gammaproteobacteria bacterium]